MCACGCVWRLVDGIGQDWTVPEKPVFIMGGNGLASLPSHTKSTILPLMLTTSSTRQWRSNSSACFICDRGTVNAESCTATAPPASRVLLCSHSFLSRLALPPQAAGAYNTETVYAHITHVTLHTRCTQADGGGERGDIENKTGGRCAKL